MSLMASQITSLTIVYSTVYSGADQRKLQSSASLAFVREIHRGPVNSPHKRPVTRKMFPFDDVIMSLGKFTRKIQIQSHMGKNTRYEHPWNPYWNLTRTHSSYIHQCQHPAHNAKSVYNEFIFKLNTSTTEIKLSAVSVTYPVSFIKTTLIIPIEFFSKNARGARSTR